MAIPDPTQTVHRNWIFSCVVTGHLVADLQVRTEFHPGEHAQLLKERIC